MNQATDAQATNHTEIIAYHGWGYDRHFWQPWKALLDQASTPNHTFSLKGFDRGYFGSPLKPSFEQPHSRKIIFAHSYGLHLCPSHQLGLADAIVVFASFVNFHPGDRKAKRRSQRILQQMITQFQTTPEAVLEAFWQNCGHRPSSPNQSETTNWTLLLQDLQDLDRSLLCADFLAHRPSQILLIQGNQDKIVAPARAEDLAQALTPALGRSPKLHRLDGPHALAATQAAACWDFCRESLLL